MELHKTINASLDEVVTLFKVGVPCFNMRYYNATVGLNKAFVAIRTTEEFAQRIGRCKTAKCLAKHIVEETTRSGQAKKYAYDLERLEEFFRIGTGRKSDGKVAS